MKDQKHIIFVINPGSTSIKTAIFADEHCLIEKNLKFGMMEVVDNFRDYVLDWDSGPLKLIRDFLDEGGIVMEEMDMVVSRGGPTPPLKSGAYGINDILINTFRHEPKLKHPAILGPEMSYTLATRVGIPSIIYDADSVDEADELPRITGLPEISRSITSHNLNGKLMCGRLANELGKPYRECKIIVVHLGGGISVCAHSGGRVIDSAFVSDGPMTPTRCGALPTGPLIDLCYEGKYSYDEMRKFTISRGGLMAYFGTSDAVEVQKMVENGNERAALVFEAMAYQTAKFVGQMAVALSGDVDAILLTGGMAHSKMQTQWIKDRTEFIAPVYIYPGEDELRALATGALRVLKKIEPIQEYNVPPRGYESVQQFYDKFGLGSVK